MLRLEAKLEVASGAELGEGPTLFPDGSVCWVDLLQGRIFRKLDGTQSEYLHFDHEVSRVLPWLHGTLVLGRVGITALDRLGQLVGRLKIHSEATNLRCSDATVLPDGSLALGIVDRDLRESSGRLIQIRRDWSVSEIITGTTISNGIDVLHDKFALWVDSPTQQLVKLDWDPITHSLKNASAYAEIPKSLGVPDGLCIDSDGGCWVALWGGGAVVRIDSAGQIDAQVNVATPNITSCCFDADNNLLITSAAVTLTAAERQLDPGAGGLWIVPATEHGRRGSGAKIAKLEVSSASLVAD